MDTEPQPQSQPTPPPPPAKRNRQGGRIVLIVVAGVLTLIGAGLALGGGAILSVFGSDGRLSSGDHEFSTPTSAFVSSVADIDGIDEVSDVVGDAKVDLTVRSARPGAGIFIGIGPATDVERYLARAPIEEIGGIDVDPFELTGRVPRPGAKRPAPPAKRDFWVAQGSGRDQATLSWEVEDGDYRLVVMNADGRRGVAVDASVGVEIPHVTTIAWILLGVGLFLLIGGIATIVITGISMARLSKRPSE
jgi:hypothetical protein